VKRHGPNHACAAATLLQRAAAVVPDTVGDASTLAVGDHCSSQNRHTAHRCRNEAACWTCRGDRRAASCISQNPQSP
jgi:hypothetical protein